MRKDFKDGFDGVTGVPEMVTKTGISCAEQWILVARHLFRNVYALAYVQGIGVRVWISVTPQNVQVYSCFGLP